MARIVYVNGRYLPWAQAQVHAEDRGFQFGDAVYEVCEVRAGRLVDETRHMARLARSLGELKIPEPMSTGAWQRVMRETIRRNRVTNGSLYLQVSRGARPREFVFSEATDLQPTVVCLARASSPERTALSAKGIGVRSMPDMRWGRCDIKTVMLLPASLAKEAAKEIGAKEAWLVDDKGFVTEGASSNAWIVDTQGRLVTRACDWDDGSHQTGAGGGGHPGRVERAAASGQVRLQHLRRQSHRRADHQLHPQVDAHRDRRAQVR